MSPNTLITPFHLYLILYLSLSKCVSLFVSLFVSNLANNQTLKSTFFPMMQKVQITNIYETSTTTTTTTTRIGMNDDKIHCCPRHVNSGELGFTKQWRVQSLNSYFQLLFPHDVSFFKDFCIFFLHSLFYWHNFYNPCVSLQWEPKNWWVFE